MKRNGGVCQKKLKNKIQENMNTVKTGLHRPMIMDGGEGKKLKTCCVVENIEHQQKKEKTTKSERTKEIAHLCIRLGRSKSVRRNGGIAPMCLGPLRSKALREVWNIAPMGK